MPLKLDYIHSNAATATMITFGFVANISQKVLIGPSQKRCSSIIATTKNTQEFM